jgi:hypothetical protein
MAQDDAGRICCGVCGLPGEPHMRWDTGCIAALQAALAAAERERDALRAERHKWHECYMGAVNLAVETQAKVDAAERARDDLEQRVYRLLTHDGVEHGCCWDARTTAVQSRVPRERDARLAALEAAARAWRNTPSTGNLRALAEAVAALDAAPADPT